MSITTIHQPVFLPWAGFFHKVFLCDSLIWLDTVQFEKGSFQNRNRLRIQNQPTWVTVPLHMRNHLHTPFHELKINEEARFKKKFLNTLQMAYARTPYFDQIYPNLKTLLEGEDVFLSRMNLKLNQYFLNYLGLTPKVFLASRLQAEGKSSELLAYLSQQAGAKMYVAGGRGQDYLDEVCFQNRNIQVLHHSYQENPFIPEGGSFLPFLSVLDLMMYKGQSSLSFLVQNNLQKISKDLP